LRRCNKAHSGRQAFKLELLFFHFLITKTYTLHATCPPAAPVQVATRLGQRAIVLFGDQATWWLILGRGSLCDGRVCGHAKAGAEVLRELLNLQ